MTDHDAIQLFDFAYAYSPRENDGSLGKYHAITRIDRVSGRLHRAAGEPLCKRKFWGLDGGRSLEKFLSYPCRQCLSVAARLGIAFKPEEA